jgi:D-alanyl-D-alanine carboxypeptidase
MRLSPAPGEGPTLLSEPALARGAPPSTLEQQAANLARGAPPVVAPAPSPAAAPPWPAADTRRAPAATAAISNTTVGAFHIQIGAYQSQAEADRRLASARELAPGLLGNRAPVMTQLKQGGKVFFRARYAGFDAPAAASACGELKKLKIDCLVMKAE